MNRTQQTAHQKLTHRGWALIERLKNDSEPNAEACYYEAQGNKLVTYPDGTMDRLEGSVKTLKFRAGWYSPAARAKRELQDAADHRTLVRASQRGIDTTNYVATIKATMRQISRCF